MIRRIAFLITVLTGALLALLTIHPAPSMAQMPDSEYRMPACATEDGVGMALCYWDAEAMGNGQGESLISGDCAPSITGDMMIYCEALYRLGPEGAEWAQLCMEIYNENSDEVLAKEGWTFEDCYFASRMI